MILKTRYKKVLRDITNDFTKSALLILSVTIGLFGIGAVLGSYSVLSREMKKNYARSVPSSATINLEKDSIGKTLLQEIKNIEGIKEVERRATFITRVKIGNEWNRILLFGIDDFKTIKMGKIFKESGAWPPLEGTLLVERTALSFMKSEIGKSILIKTSNGLEKEVIISGTVHDPGVAPSWQDLTGYAYVTESTLKTLRIENGFTELKILLDDSINTNEEKIREKALLVSESLSKKGFAVHEIQIPPPAKHPHQVLMTTAMTIQLLFGFMLFVLASILVCNAVATLMVKQIREIGVMKALGANSVQISGLYFAMIFILSAVALIIAVTLSPFASGYLIKIFSGFFNLTIYDAAIPVWVYVAQAMTGILIPLIVAGIPIYNGGRRNILSALNNYGVSKSKPAYLLVKTIAKVHFLNEITMLSLRNVFRQPSRMILSIVLLTIGGTLFMTAINLSKSWEVITENIYASNKYDLELTTSEPIKNDSAINKIAELSKVKKIEKWLNVPASFDIQKEKYQISHSYPDRGHGTMVLFGIPVPSEMISLPIVKGKWLSNENTNEIVLPVAQLQKYNIHDYIKLNVDEQIAEWKIVGFYKEIVSDAIGYTSVKALNKATHTEGRINMLRISTNNRTTEPISEIQNLLSKENFPASTFSTISIRIDSIEKHLRVLVRALLMMGILMAVVGIVGLMSVISIGILERTRELGVIRSIGATPQQIIKLLLGEGIFIALISFFFAVLISIVVTLFLGSFLGNISFKVPLTMEVSPIGIVTWMLIVIASSVLATSIPARRANRMSIREALTY